MAETNGHKQTAQTNVQAEEGKHSFKFHPQLADAWCRFLHHAQCGRRVWGHKSCPHSPCDTCMLWFKASWQLDITQLLTQSAEWGRVKVRKLMG